MDSLNSTFLSTTTQLLPPASLQNPPAKKPNFFINSSSSSSYSSSPSVRPDPWSLSDGNITKPKPKSKNPKHPLSDDDARRIIKKKAAYLSVLRRNQGPRAMTPKWIKRTPEQMVQYLEDDRNGNLYGKHVVAAIKTVRGMAGKKDADIRVVMGSFVTKLSFREMCVVLKEQKGWKQVENFFGWMKLQLCYRPSVVVYTIVLRLYGQVGKINLAEQTFLEMLEAGCEPDEVACGTMLCSYARWGRHKAMLTFYSAVQERGITLPITVYNFMLSSLQKKSLHGDVLDIWRQLVHEGVAPNAFTYTVVISSFVKNGLHEEAFKTFNEMMNIGFVPEEVTYSILISLCVRQSNWNEALRLYEDMRSRGIVPSNYTCASMLTLYYKTEDYSNALSLFSDMERNKVVVDEVIYGLLIRIYGKLGLYEDSWRTFEEIERLGILKSEKTYLAMAQVYLHSGDVDKALNIIELMKARNIEFSRFAYIISLQCYARKEDLSSAEYTFQALSKTGFPDASSCNDLLSMYVKMDLMDKAKKLLTQLTKDQVDFNEELYKTVMMIYCKEGMLKDAEKLTEDMITTGSFKDKKFIQTLTKAMQGGYVGHLKFKNETEPPPEQLDSKALELMLRMYIADGNLSKAEEILKLLLETGNGLSGVSQLINRFDREGDVSKIKSLGDLVIKQAYKLDDEKVASFIGLYGKQKKLKQAEELFIAVKDSPTSRRFCFNSMIDAYCRCGRPEEAYLLFKESVQKGHDLGPVAISIAVNALTSSGKHREAEDIITKSLENNFELDTVAYNTFIKAMLEAGKLQFAGSIYERMLTVGVSPSIQTISTMISVYGRGRKLDKAMQMFNSVRSFGLSLDEKAYMNMITYYGKAGKWHEASLLFTKMQKQGIKPGTISYSIMMNLYATAGLHYEAENLFQAMLKDDCSPNSLTYLYLIQAYAEGLKYNEAENTLISMTENGFPVSCVHFNPLLSAFAKAGMKEEAERVYNKVLAAGIVPDLACVRAMLRVYINCGRVEDGISFFERVRKSTESDRFLMSAAVYLYEAAGRKVEADEVLESMNRLRIPFLKNIKVGMEGKKA